jgi:MFS transporter, PAT family, beta-lactamase induction signal transducer AmpG
LPLPNYTRPPLILFLVLPAGISFGFATVTLPYLLTQHGFTVFQTANIVALGVSASLWRFVWGPLTDLTLSLKKWFWMASVVSSASIILLSITPLRTNGVFLLTIIVFVSQVAANLVLIPVGGIMANRIERTHKGRAGGWYQAGNLGGIGLGGGVGLWLSSHYSVLTAGIVLSIISMLSAFVIVFIKEVQRDEEKRLAGALNDMGKEVVSMLKIPVVLFVILLLCMPIGTGAANNLWAAIAADWKTNADTVALVTGILGGMVSALGCLTGGFVADRWGNWVAYFGAGLFCAAVTFIMAVFPMQQYVYISGVLAYSFGVGLFNAAFSSIILYAIGTRNASTKYALLSSLGNLPVVYMTTFDGWTHDRFDSRNMLVAEAIVGVLFVAICIFVTNRLKAKKLLLATID